MLKSSLITTSRSDDILQSYSTKNLTQNEILNAVGDDLRDRINSIEDVLGTLLSESSSRIFGSVLIPDGNTPVGRYKNAAGYQSYDDFLIGRSRISEQDAGVYQNILRTAFADSFSGTAIVYPDDNQGYLSSLYSIEMQSGTLTPYSSTYIIRKYGEAVTDFVDYYVHVIIRVPIADDYAAIVLAKVTDSDGNMSDEYCGYFAETRIPTHAYFKDYTQHPSYPTWESFTVDQLIKELAENASMYQIMSDAITYSLNGLTSISDFATLVRSKFSTFSSGCSDILQTIMSNGLSLSGITTSISIIASGLNSGEATDSNHFAFTDNNEYLPTSFAAGMVLGLVQSVGAIVTAVGLFTSKIVAVVGMVLSGAAKLVELIVNAWKSGATQAKLDENATLACFSPGLVQLTLPYGNVGLALQTQLSYNGVVQFQHCGCRVLAFIKDLVLGEDGSIHSSSTIGFEVHVSMDILPTQSAFSWFNQWIYSSGDSYGWNLPRRSVIETQFEDLLDSQPSFSDFFQSIDDDDIDEYIRRTYFINFLFTMTSLLCSGDQTLTLNPAVVAFIDGPGTPFGRMIEKTALCVRDINKSTPDYSGIPSWREIMNPTVNGNIAGLFNSSYFDGHRGWNQIAFNNSQMTYAVNQYTTLTISQLIMYNLVDATIDPYFIIPINGEIRYIVCPAKYESETFWLSVIAAAVVVAVVAVTAVIATVKIKKKISAWNAKHQAQTENAWQAYTEDPSEENYSAYRSAVSRNNWLTKITGGTKYSYTNYWGDTSDSDSSVSILERLRNLSDKTEEDTSSIEEIKLLITGA